MRTMPTALVMTKLSLAALQGPRQAVNHAADVAQLAVALKYALLEDMQCTANARSCA